MWQGVRLRCETRWLLVCGIDASRKCGVGDKGKVRRRSLPRMPHEIRNELNNRRLTLLSSLRLDGRDGDGVYDVFGGATAGEVVAGAVEALEDGADGGAAG